MANTDFEKRSLELLVDVHNELSQGIDSLGNKEGNGYVEHFKFWSSVYMNAVSNGFIHLRQAGLLKESRFLVRPAVELHIKQKAIAAKPDLIYRLGRDETMSDITWLRAIAGQTNELFDEEHFSAELERFSKSCMKVFPAGDFRSKKITMEELAQSGVGQEYYNSYYRIYCKFTHATLRAIIGSLDEITTDHDNLLMIDCALYALETSGTIGGATLRLHELRTREEVILQESLKIMQEKLPR
jgi:uncharacterized protein DUF5677